MANYPSYYPNQNPYQPNTYQQYQYQPPYQQNIQPVQQQIQQMPSGLNGRIVDDFNTLTANDVPMDSYGAVFIKRDGSEIQWRRWGGMGSIEMTSYKPILEQNSQEGTNMPQIDFNALNEDIKAIREEITERFDKLEKSMTTPTTKASSSRSKSKEVDTE